MTAPGWLVHSSWRDQVTPTLSSTVKREESIWSDKYFPLHWRGGRQESVKLHQS
jgi:hypothetical protein